MPDLLIELLSEEIPARMQAKAAEDLRRLLTDALVEAGLTYAGAAAFATPRRLALAVEDLSERSRPVREERKGPATTAPDAAIQGFLRSTGLSLDRLERRQDRKGETFFAVIERPGREAPEIVAEALERVIRDFPWPKSMRWGSGSLRWVRPLQGILCLLVREGGAEVVPFEIEGLSATGTTRGHRFHAPQGFSVTSFEDYEARLKRAHVVLRAEERRDRIRHDAATLAFARGWEVVEDEALLHEVAGLVEWPVTLMGRIEEEFLHLPPEVLRTSMKEHQKFFSVKNPATGRIEGFVTVANIDTRDRGETILQGNAKVLRARLSDARFFWENDLRVARAGMQEWKEGLKSVTFHNKLGSQWERIQRIQALAREIAPLVGADPDLAAQAAEHAKLDLRSAMVGEFPELQGLMGRYYASAAGLPPEVAAAAQEHYSPLGPTDAVPTAPLSVAVALADKIDTLTGFWAIDEKPTGSKDPFALRRAALGVIRLVLASGSRLKLVDVFFTAALRLYMRSAKGGNGLPTIIDQLGYEYDVDDIVTRMGPEKALLFSAPWARTAFASLLERATHEELGRIDLNSFTTAIEKALPSTQAMAVANSRNPTSHESQFARLYAEFTTLFDSGAGPVLDVGDLRDRTVHSKRIISPRTFEHNLSLVGGHAEFWRTDLLAFLHDRLKVHLREQGIRHDVIDACLAMPGNDDLVLLARRAEALAAFLKTEDGENLLLGFRRAANLLAQAEERDGVEYSFGADPKWAETDEERAIFAALDATEARIRPAMEREDFAEAMAALAALRAPLDAFLDTALVNTDNGVLRRNRLNLLSRIRRLCLEVADLSRIEG